MRDVASAGPATSSAIIRNAETISALAAQAASTLTHVLDIMLPMKVGLQGN